jgi:hypothetical protein
MINHGNFRIPHFRTNPLAMVHFKGKVSDMGQVIPVYAVVLSQSYW